MKTETSCSTDRMRCVVYTAGGVLYIRPLCRNSGGVILETFEMTSNDTAILDTSVKQKKYTSKYISKHGRQW